MKYRILITVNMPYPVQKQYDQDCSNVATAVARSLRTLRGDMKGKRIAEYLIKARQLQHGGIV